jgi:hypothetical protein
MDSERERWDLSAPASQVLLTGAATPNAWAVKLAFKELVLRRNLRLWRERRRRLLVLPRNVDLLALNHWAIPGSERALRGVMEAFPKAAIFQSNGEGVPIEVAATEVQRWYRPGGGYVQAEVLPELERRGYYRRIELERGPEWQLTDEGMQKLAELRALLETGKTEFPGWLRNEPGKAAAYLMGAGAVLLLLGNPATWLWELMSDVLAGGTVAAEGIPAGAGPPFAGAPQQERSEREGGSESAPGGQTSETKESEEAATPEGGSHSPGSPIDDAQPAGGGGGGGFDSPGETIDGGFAKAADSDADGDSEGDGE